MTTHFSSKALYSSSYKENLLHDTFHTIIFGATPKLKQHSSWDLIFKGISYSKTRLMVFTQLRWVFLWCRWWSNLNRVYKVWWCLNPKKNAFATQVEKTNSLTKILMITTCFVKFSKLVFKFCLQWKEHSHQYLVIYSDHLVSNFQSDLWE